MTTLYFEQQNNLISIHLRADTSVNAWNGTIEISNTSAIANIVTKDSNGEIWRTSPIIVEGKGIAFSGGLPNGFTGDMIVFQFELRGAIPLISFSKDTALYLNDGKGTEIQVASAPFILNKNISYSSSILNDTIPPEPFTPEIYQDANSFGFLPVAIFSAHDSGSGIQKYEVREITARGGGIWQTAESPYAINPDVVKLEIRACDNAGNVRTEELAILQSTSYSLFFAIVACVIAVLMMYNLFKKWRKNH